MSDKIRMTIDGPVRTVTLARPEKGNALDAEMLAELEDVFAPDPGPGTAERVAVIRSEGRVFCAGLDLRGGLGRDQNVETLFHRVESWPLPVVAVVQGAAIAGGNELALHCDFVVAADTARGWVLTRDAGRMLHDVMFDDPESGRAQMRSILLRTPGCTLHGQPKGTAR